MYGEYDPEILNKLHHAELQMLKDFEDLCERNQIEYFAIAGTAIGAVRHKGFIPWDDDIDIAFLRKDYVKFVKAMGRDKVFCQKYALWGPDQKHRYYNLQPTLMLRDTVFINENAAAGGYRPGILMDLFIYDNIPEDKRKADIIIKKCQRYKILYIIRNVNFFKLLKGKPFIQKVKNIICGFIRIGLRMLPKSDEILYQKFLKYATMYKDQSDKYTCLFDPGAHIMHIWKKKSYPTVKLPFEDTQIRLVKNYDEQLKQHMGNYMEVPPIEKRTNHSPVEIDFGDVV